MSASRRFRPWTKRPCKTLASFGGTALFLVFIYNCGGSSSKVDSIPSIGTLRAFPGAGGFGAGASGGRGGKVIAVTTLADGGAGSLKEALAATGPRTIVFQVSGVIDGIAEIVHGNVTIAGQTSPCGIVVRGLVCDTVYDTGNDCENMIIRNVRSRPGTTAIRAATRVLDDGIRLDGVSNVILDHVEASGATDEAFQVSGSKNVTLQSSILAETPGEHAEFGGNLLNYSSATKPLQNVALIGNLWFHLGGRLPEISCEENENYGTSNCKDSRLHIEISRNFYMDPGAASMFENTDASQRYLDLNWFGNVSHARASFPYGMIAAGFVTEAKNAIYASENSMNLYPARKDLDLAYCCNDYSASAQAATVAATVRSTRHEFPDLGRWDSVSGSLQEAIAASVGPFPRDPRTLRYTQAVQSDSIPGGDYTAVAPGGTDLDAYEPVAGCTATVPTDTDGDGMPDTWEASHGLSSADATDGNATGLSVSLMGAAGYTNLESYLHETALALEAP